MDLIFSCNCFKSLASDAERPAFNASDFCSLVFFVAWPSVIEVDEVDCVVEFIYLPFVFFCKVLEALFLLAVRGGMMLFFMKI